MRAHKRWIRSVPSRVERWPSWNNFSHSNEHRNGEQPKNSLYRRVVTCSKWAFLPLDQNVDPSSVNVRSKHTTCCAIVDKRIARGSKPVVNNYGAPHWHVVCRFIIWFPQPCHRFTNHIYMYVYVYSIRQYIWRQQCQVILQSRVNFVLLHCGRCKKTDIRQ